MALERLRSARGPLANRGGDGSPATLWTCASPPPGSCRSSTPMHGWRQSAARVALHHARIALSAQGWHATVTRMPDNADRELLVRLQLESRAPPAHPSTRTASVPSPPPSRRPGPMPPIALRPFRETSSLAVRMVVSPCRRGWARPLTPGGTAGDPRRQQRRLQSAGCWWPRRAGLRLPRPVCLAPGTQAVAVEVCACREVGQVIAYETGLRTSGRPRPGRGARQRGNPCLSCTPPV